MLSSANLVRALAFGSAVGSAAPVRAQDYGFSGGLSVVVWFGGGEPIGGLTFDVRGTGLLEGPSGNCVSAPRAGIGAFAQATWLFVGGARLGLGLHGGQEVGDSSPYPSWDVELGWTYRSELDGRPAGHGLHVGVLGHAVFFELAARMAFTFLDDGVAPESGLGFGVRMPGPLGGTFGWCAVGRPLRCAERVVRPRVASRVRADVRPTTEPIHQAIGRAWLEDMRDEAASVPAFAILAHDLTAVGAPTRLIEGARAARRDEIRHTRMCGELAARHLGLDVRPEPLPTERPERPSLERLVIESWRDGCLGEGAAARRAACAAARATDDTTRRVQGHIAHDEARHAELAWAVLAFALDAAPKTRDLLAAELAATPTSPRATHDPDDRAWIAQGRLGAADLDDTWHANHADALRRARRLIDHA